MVPNHDRKAFAQALLWIESLPTTQRFGMRQAVADTVEAFSLRRSVEQLINLYTSIVDTRGHGTSSCWRPSVNTMATGGGMLGIYLWSVIRALTMAA